MLPTSQPVGRAVDKKYSRSFYRRLPRRTAFADEEKIVALRNDYVFLCSTYRMRVAPCFKSESSTWRKTTPYPTKLVSFCVIARFRPRFRVSAGLCFLDISAYACARTSANMDLVRVSTEPADLEEKLSSFLVTGSLRPAFHPTFSRSLP